MATIPEAVAIARDHLQAGRLADAESVCRQILAVEPNETETLNLLGVISTQQRGDPSNVLIDHGYFSAAAADAVFAQTGQETLQARIPYELPLVRQRRPGRRGGRRLLRTSAL